MRKLRSDHGMYKLLPQLLKGELVHHHGKTYQCDKDCRFVFEMRFDSYPTMFGTDYSWFPDYAVYQIIGRDLFYCEVDDALFA